MHIRPGSAIRQPNFWMLMTLSSYLKYVLLIFIDTDLILTGLLSTFQVSHWIPDTSNFLVNRWTPLRLARPHWLNHQPVFSLKLLQLLIGGSWREQAGLQPSLSTSKVLKGNVSWLSSFLYPRNASPKQE